MNRVRAFDYVHLHASCSVFMDVIVFMEICMRSELTL